MIESSTQNTNDLYWPHVDAQPARYELGYKYGGHPHSFRSQNVRQERTHALNRRQVAKFKRPASTPIDLHHAG